MKAAKRKDISKGKEKEVVRRVTASEKEKKHYVAKFLHLTKTGCVRRSNMMGIQEEIFATTANKKPIIRPLGPKIDLRYDSPNSTMNSSQTYFVDVNVNDNELTRLHGEVSKVFEVTKKARLLHEDDQATLSGLKANLDRRITENNLIRDMQVRLKTIEDDALWKIDFVRKGIEVSLRAFMDYVLQCTFQKAGLVGSNSNIGAEFTTRECSEWLWSLAAKQFFLEEITVIIFGASLELNRGFLDMLREFKATSSSISKREVHSSSPFQVAFALSALGHSVNINLGRLYEHIFGMGYIDVMHKYENDQLSPEEKANLSGTFTVRK